MPICGNRQKSGILNTAGEGRKGDNMDGKYQTPELQELRPQTEEVMADVLLGSNETSISDLLQGVGEIGGV